MNVFVNYLFFSSSVLIYSLGIGKSVELSQEKTNPLPLFLWQLLTIVPTVLIGFGITNYILSRLHLIEIFPFLVCMTFFAISMGLYLLFQKFVKIQFKDFGFSLLVSILALSEGNTVLESVCISLCGILSFMLVIPVLYSLRQRIQISHPNKDFALTLMLLVTIGILVFTIFSFNVSWLSGGAAWQE